jgi:hypothetical protein
LLLLLRVPSPVLLPLQQRQCFQCSLLPPLRSTLIFFLSGALIASEVYKVRHAWHGMLPFQAPGSATAGIPEQPHSQHKHVRL